MRTLTLLVVFLVTTVRCGNTGGIVDNGQHPEGDPTPSAKTSSDPSHNNYISILSQYYVEVAKNTWTSNASFSSDTSTAIQTETKSIKFTFIATVCAHSAQRVNAYGTTIYICSSYQTQLRPKDGTLILATHTERDDDIEAVLNSFR